MRSLIGRGSRRKEAQVICHIRIGADLAVVLGPNQISREMAT